MPNICIFGASITWGAFDREAGGWADRLKTHFWQKGDTDTDVYNYGVSGDKVSDVLKRFDFEAAIKPPNIVLFSVGINDSLHSVNFKGTPLEEFRKNYQQLIERAKKFTEKIIIVGLTNVDEEIERKGYKNEEIKKYNKVMKEVAAEKNLKFIDLFGILTKEDLSIDGLHPDANGHKKIFERVLEVLENGPKTTGSN
jgi:lysophospholipase L1-like esterase